MEKKKIVSFIIQGLIALGVWQLANKFLPRPAGSAATVSRLALVGAVAVSLEAADAVIERKLGVTDD